MKNLEINNLLNLNETISSDLFNGKIYPWEIFKDLSEYIIKLGKTLDLNRFDKIKDNVWIAKNANVAESAYIMGPAIIDENTEIRHGAFIRENVIIGKECIVGNSTEIKNSILFNNVEVPHFNYVGDSVLGYKSHMGASSILSNLRSDKKNVTIKIKEEKIQTGLQKFGAILGDGTEIGCGAVLNPGTITKRNVLIYPLKSVSGYIDE